MVLYCEHPLLGVKKTKPFLHLSLGKAGPFTLESHSCVKAFECKVSQIIRCLIKPLLKNSIQTIFQGGTSWVAQLLNNIIVWMVLYCEHPLLGLKKSTKPFLHISLAKAGPFTLESNVCVKALKCKVSQIRCLIKPLLKNSIQTIFQGGTSWVAQLLNSDHRWRGSCCPGKFLDAGSRTSGKSPAKTFRRGRSVCQGTCGWSWNSRACSPPATCGAVAEHEANGGASAWGRRSGDHTSAAVCAERF